MTPTNGSQPGAKVFTALAIAAQALWAQWVREIVADCSKLEACWAQFLLAAELNQESLPNRRRNPCVLRISRMCAYWATFPPWYLIGRSINSGIFNEKTLFKYQEEATDIAEIALQGLGGRAERGQSPFPCRGG
jgi:hypothetical protein